MQINKRLVSEMVIQIRLDERELHRIVAEYVFELAGYDPDKLGEENVTFRVAITKKDRTGTAGVEDCAEVKVVIDLSGVTLNDDDEQKG